MDFLDQFTAKINLIPDLPAPLKKGYLGIGNSFVIYGIPGSQITDRFMDGSYVESLNYEIAMQSQDPELLHDTLWMVQTEIEKFVDIPSADGSYEFEQITITNKPFINQLNDQGWFIFVLDLTAEITIQNKGAKING